MRKYSDEQFLEHLGALAAKTSQLALANRLKVPPSIICDTLKGRREPGPKLLSALGFRRVISYIQK